MKNYTITVNGVAYNVTVEENNGSAPAVNTAPISAAAPAAPVSQPAVPNNASTGAVAIEAPMPGNVLDIKTKVGANVSSGETLIILEAMKMENEIVAPSEGVVASVNVNKGDSVEAGQVLITLN